MSTVTVTLIDGEAAPVNRLVRAKLVGSIGGTYRTVEGFTADGILVGSVERLSGSDGTAVLELVDNSEIAPATKNASSSNYFGVFSALTGVRTA